MASLPYAVAQNALKAVIAAFPESLDPRSSSYKTRDAYTKDKRRLRRLAGEWETDVLAEIEEDWWREWPPHEQNAFIGDLQALQVRYPAQSRSRGESLSVCRIQYLVGKMEAEFRRRGDNVQAIVDWFKRGFTDAIPAKEFDALAGRSPQHATMAASVVHEFNQVLVAIQAGSVTSANLPGTLDPGHFGALIRIRHELAREREQRNREAAAEALLALPQMSMRSLAHGGGHGRVRLSRRQQGVYGQAWTAA